MKLARYYASEGLRIEDAPVPEISDGELLVKTAACGLCSGELMDWYLDRKAPHVLGHEVSGFVIESCDSRFPVGSLIAPHHHANCGECQTCISGAEVHCEQWSSTKLDPGGMSEFFRVPAANLGDTAIVSDLGATDAALMEPLGCVCKSIARAQLRKSDKAAVIGLGALGLMHMLVLKHRGIACHGFELKPKRREWAASLGLDATERADSQFDVVFVLPGLPAALHEAARITRPGGKIILFAPLGPGQSNDMDFTDLYFRDISLIPSYSAGSSDTGEALKILREGAVCAEQVVSDFVTIDELPNAYEAMKKGEILKAMVVF